MRYILLFVALAVFSSCVSPKKVPGSPENTVIAHRGAWKAKGFPENSIAALQHAIRLKCSGAEFDIRMTANDSLIVTHDADYADMDIETTTYQELSRFPLRNGEMLPTLRNYLVAGIENNATTLLVCEIKPSGNKERSILIAEKVWQLVTELKAQDRVAYISFSYAVLKRLEELDSTVHTQYLDGSKSPEQLKADGIDGADYYFEVFKNHPEWIASAKKHKIYLNAWTVNKPADIDWLLEKGFDYITTNEPELVFERAKIKGRQ